MYHLFPIGIGCPCSTYINMILRQIRIIRFTGFTILNHKFIYVIVIGKFYNHKIISAVVAPFLIPITSYIFIKK